MIVLVPFVKGMLHPRVLPAIERQGYEAQPIEMIGPTDYRESLTKWFNVCLNEWRVDLMIVEHDVESRSGLLEEIEQCDEPWCFSPYPMSNPWNELGLDYPPLGHTRFSPEVGGPLSALVETDWWNALPRHGDLDGAIGHWLGSRDGGGYTAHPHASVVHHHKYPRTASTGHAS